MQLTSPASTESATGYRPDIDGLRALAVSIVVAYHAFPAFMPGGFSGVDVFFVISGFLITRLILVDLAAGVFRLGAFYQRRVRRIVPALLVVLFTCALVGWFVLLPSELQWLGRTLAWCASFLANAFFAKTGSYFDTATELNPLLHLWSLGVEEQFYLLWPVLLLLATRRGVQLSVLIAVTAASLAISIWGATHSPAQSFYLLAVRAWELGAGGLLIALQQRRPPGGQPWAAAASILGLALIAGGAMLLNSDLAFPGAWGLIPTCGAVLLIAAGPRAPVNRLLLAARPVMFVGRISYPLYLWHWPALAFERILLGSTPSAAMAGGAILFAVLAAYCSYLFLETPVRRGDYGRKAVPVLIAGLAVVALAGGAAQLRLFPGRLSGPQVAAVDEAINDWHYPGGFNFAKASGFRTLTTPSHRSRKALFVGDSHMEQYWSRVTHVIETQPDSARSAVFATYAGCPPMPGVINPRRGWSCSAFFDYAVQQAMQSDVDTVAFGAFWEGYLLGEYSADKSQRIYRVRDLARQPLRLGSPGTELAFNDFRAAIAQLVASGRRVFIVLSNPTSPLFNPLSFLPLRARLAPHSSAGFAIDKGRRTVDVTAFAAFAAPVMDRLREVARQAGATVIDPRDYLCEEMQCPAITPDGVPLYLDSNHLRPFFARERATFIDQILLGAVNSAAQAPTAPYAGFPRVPGGRSPTGASVGPGTCDSTNSMRRTAPSSPGPCAGT